MSASVGENLLDDGFSAPMDLSDDDSGVSTDYVAAVSLILLALVYVFAIGLYLPFSYRFIQARAPPKLTF